MSDTGCARAIADRDRLRQQCPPLAYGLHLWPGRVCSRLGGAAVCGICVGDLREEESLRIQDASAAALEARTARLASGTKNSALEIQTRSSGKKNRAAVEFYLNGKIS